MPLFLLPVSLLSLSVAYSLSITLHSDINSNFQKVAKTVKITPIYALEGFINTLDLNPFALSLVFYFYGDLNILLQLHNTPPPPKFSGIENTIYYTNGFPGSGIWIGHSGHACVSSWCLENSKARCWKRVQAFSFTCLPIDVCRLKTRGESVPVYAGLPTWSLSLFLRN